MKKRWIVIAAAVACSSFSFGQGQFMRWGITPITFSNSLNAYLGGKTSTFLIQPIYSWADDHTDPGITLAYGVRPSGDDTKKATLFALHFDRWHPDEGDSTNATGGFVSHVFSGNDSPFMSCGTLFYFNFETVGTATGGNYTVGTRLFGNDKDPGFAVGCAANYEQWDPTDGPIERGALSINVSRALSDTLYLEYDHTFASKYFHEPDWFFRTTWDAKPGTQVRFTVGKGEVYAFEIGFFVGAR